MDKASIERRVQRARVVVARFGPILEAGLSQEWSGVVTGEPDWPELCHSVSFICDESSNVGVETFSSLLESIGGLLDLWDEDPPGGAYYPYKAAELIELHCRQVTGDLPDNAPVGLGEWIQRFARHVDWQLERSGSNLEAPHFFAALEESLEVKANQLSGADETAFHMAMEASREAAARYLGALRSALAAPGAQS